MGVIILFVGFNDWTYLEMLIGLALLTPVFFISDTPTAIIRFRKDIQKEIEIQQCKKAILKRSLQIEEQQKKIDHLDALFLSLYPEEQSPPTQV